MDPNRNLPPRFYDRVLERVSALPGVHSASVSWATPAGFSMSMRAISIPGRRGPGPQGRVTAWNDTVSAGYFETFGIKLLRGRLPSDADTVSTPRVAVINELLARSYFDSPDNALGRHFSFGTESGPVPVQVVGVVANTRQTELREAPPMMYYLPLSQEAHPATWAADLSVRASGEVTGLTARPAPRDSRRARRRDCDLHPDAQPADGRPPVPRAPAQPLSGLFAALALVLAGVGLFGVMSYAVAPPHWLASWRTDPGVYFATGGSPVQTLGRLVGRGPAGSPGRTTGQCAPAPARTAQAPPAGPHCLAPASARRHPRPGESLAGCRRSRAHCEHATPNAVRRCA